MPRSSGDSTRGFNESLLASHSHTLPPTSTRNSGLVLAAFNPGWFEGTHFAPNTIAPNTLLKNPSRGGFRLTASRYLSIQSGSVSTTRSGVRSVCTGTVSGFKEQPVTACSLRWSLYASPTNRNGCSVQEIGLSISAVPSTGPLWVRNITLIRVPRISGFDKRSRPPVEEMTSRLPVVESPPWNRSTAGVYSGARTRGARQATDGAERLICLPGSIVCILHCVGDYQRMCADAVTRLQLLPVTSCPQDLLLSGL